MSHSTISFREVQPMNSPAANKRFEYAACGGQATKLLRGLAAAQPNRY